ncbi:MAG: hypothetical protein WCD35_05000 [Mycobacteriales bacterium]
MTLLRDLSRAGLTLGAALAALLLTPLLGPGAVLVRDSVFVPGIPLGAQLLGVDGVPRAVPSDLVVALGSRVLPVGWLQDLVLVALVVGATWGAVRLAPTRSRVAALAAGSLYGWSPFLHERLLLGQWALLVGWAVLPWAAAAALRWRDGEPCWAALGWLAVASVGGASALLLVALVVALCGRPVQALLATALLSLPWALPALLQPGVRGDPAGVAAFASRADTPFGVVGSLLTGGGVWAPAAVPPGRAAGSAVAVALVVLAATGLPLVRERLGDRLLWAGLAGLLLALLGRLPGAADALRWAVVHVPATGLLRDGSKWVAPLLLVTSAGLGCAVEGLLPRVRQHRVRQLAGALAVVAPLAALPGAAWGESGRLHVASLPAEWGRTTSLATGPVLVLPWRLYRAFPWNGDRTVLDPATKLLRHPVVDDDLPLATGVVQGEDPLAARLDAAVSSGAPLLPALRAEGVTGVLVERRDRGYDEGRVRRQVSGLTLVRRGPELALYSVPGARARAPQRRLWPVLLGDLLAAGFALVAVARAVRRRAPY